VGAFLDCADPAVRDAARQPDYHETVATRKTKLIKSHCNGCGRETSHHVLGVRDFSESFFVKGYGDAYSTDCYQLIECAGCQSVSMRHTAWVDITDQSDVTIYPPPVARRRPHWLSSLPSTVQLLMKQVYAALDSNSRALAVMGARAAVDIVLVEHVGDTGGFGQKLKAAESVGVISGKNSKVLAAALEACNAAAHRGHQPSTADVNAVIDIVENLLQAVYQLDSLADRLKQSTPKRPKT
jgi:Domain of unknown function (DUF4145)